MVAACQLFCSTRDQMVAGLEPEPVEARDQRGNPPVPLRIGQPHVAIDDGERVRIARHAGEKARAKIKHRFEHRSSVFLAAPRMIHLHPMTKHEVPTARNQCAAAGPQPARLARPSRRPRPAGRAQAEYRPEVRAGGLCQAARRPARHGVSEARRPSDPGGVGARLRPRLDGRGDGCRAVRDAGRVPGRGVQSDAVAGGRVGAGAGGRAPRAARPRQAPAAADPQRARRRPLHRGRHHDRAQSENRKAERLDPPLPAHRSRTGSACWCCRATPSRSTAWPRRRASRSTPRSSSASIR